MFCVCSDRGMIRRPRRPTFPHHLEADFLVALERTRHFAVDFGSAHRFSAEQYKKSPALTEAIDGMAEDLTGDRSHFHLKGMEGK
jgi:hypothetical protein